jgi:hypothetical protein
VRGGGPAGRGALAAGGLALLIGLAGSGNRFVYDDVQAIVENPLVHGLGHSFEIWRSAYWPLGLLYRPLTVQFFAIEWWLGGGSPIPFHVANAVLYFLVTLLVARIGQRLLSPPGGLAAGLLFAVHPVHVEVVANGVGQSELLAGLFVLLALDRFLSWRTDPAGFAGPRRLALAGLYALAVAGKETGYVLPLLLLAVILLDPGPGGRRAELRAARPLFLLLGAVAAAGLLIRVILFGGLAGEIPQLPLRGLGTTGRAVAMLGVAPEWARLLLVPLRLQAHYGPPGLSVSPTLGPAQLTGLGLAAGTLVLFGLAARRAPPVAIGLAWLGAGLLPVSNLPAATGVLLAERTLFLPSVGFSLVVGGLVSLVAGQPAPPAWRRIGFLAGVFGLGLLAGRSLARTRVWKDQETFFAQLERDAPDSYRAQLTAGIYYKGQGRFAEAERAIHRAWLLYRDDPSVFEEYGQLFRVQRRCDRALPVLEEGVSRHPEATVVRARLVECALALGDTGRARRVAWEAVQLGQSEFQSTLDRLAPAR